MKNRQALLDLINKKIAEVQANKGDKPKRKPATRADTNHENGQHSTGPRTPEGKERASANSLKHGYYANIEKLNPQDNPVYIELHHDLRISLHPDGPAEEHLIREIAAYSARILRVQMAGHALVLGNIEGEPPIASPEHTDKSIVCDQEMDGREIAAAYKRAHDDIEFLHKIETHLTRAYNRTWDRLERMQKERNKLPLDEMLKRSHVWLTAEALRKNRPQDAPALHPDLDEKGKFKKREKGDPLYRPKDDDEDDNIDPENDLN